MRLNFRFTAFIDVVVGGVGLALGAILLACGDSFGLVGIAGYVIVLVDHWLIEVKK